jgi:hypothetical protein
MVYKQRTYIPGFGDTFGLWSIGNCVVSQHPVLTVMKWSKTHKDQQYVLLFYDKLPDDVADLAKDLDISHTDPS